jgi:NAD(P)-dependent dehydrogenase (short-subunit alcohol dehydrogenase family)
VSNGVADHTALVTGASGGLGVAICTVLAERGWHVLAAVRNPTRADDLMRSVQDKPGRVEVVRVDLADPTAIKDGVAEALNRVEGRLGALVHNAGLPGAGFLADPDAPDVMRRTMETNFIGPVQLTAELLPSLRLTQGRIVVVSSIAAFMTLPGLSAYVASKWALEGWCSSLAIELMPLGIKVLLVEPGTYRTPIWNNQVPKPGIVPFDEWAERLQQRRDRLVEHLGREPREVGEKVGRLLESDHPPFRNPVGPDSWFAWGVVRFVPPRLRNRALALATGAPKSPPTPPEEHAPPPLGEQS